MSPSRKYFWTYKNLFLLVIFLASSCQTIQHDKNLKVEFKIFYKESGTISICLSNTTSSYINPNIVRQIVTYSDHLARSGSLSNSVVLLSYYYGNLSENSLYDEDGGDILETYEKSVARVHIKKDENSNYFILGSLKIKINNEWYQLDLDYYSTHLKSCR